MSVINSVVTSMTYIREADPMDSPEVYKEHAIRLADEVERLRLMNAETTHHRRKPKQDAVIRSDIYSVKEGENIFIIPEEKSRRVVADDEKYFESSHMIPISLANDMLDSKKAFRIPNHMNYGGANYRLIDVLDETLVLYYSIKGLDKDGSFHDHMSLWIPQPEESKKKYVKLTISMLGEDRWGDRIFMDTYHYKSDDNSWESSYHSRKLQKAGSYKPYVLEMLNVYREMTNRPDFLKKQKK
jgi:hypothetical protein